MESDDSGETRSKVARVIAGYDLDGMGNRLVERWTGVEGERTSLRDLAHELNREILRAAMADAGRNPMERVVERSYEALTDDDVSEGRRAEVRNELSRDGVDVEALREDFVSHQSVHTYLTTVRDATAPSTGSDPVETDVEAIQRLLGRTATVADNALERHRGAERVVLGEFDVFLDLRVLCHRCGTDRDVVALLENGGYACDESAETSVD